MNSSNFCGKLYNCLASSSPIMPYVKIALISSTMISSSFSTAFTSYSSDVSFSLIMTISSLVNIKSFSSNLIDVISFYDFLLFLGDYFFSVFSVVLRLLRN